jgi:hypothetical protein
MTVEKIGQWVGAVIVLSAGVAALGVFGAVVFWAWKVVLRW